MQVQRSVLCFQDGTDLNFAECRLRWRFEGWQRAPEAGCKVECLGHRRGERSERAVTINAVVAWRLASIAQAFERARRLHECSKLNQELRPHKETCV